jgi:hypothetical protein
LYLDPYTGKFGGLPVSPEGIDMTAKDGKVEDYIGEYTYYQEYPNGVGNSKGTSFTYGQITAV